MTGWRLDCESGLVRIIEEPRVARGNGQEYRYTRCARPAEPESEECFWTPVPGVKTPGYYLSPLRGFEVACGC